MINFADMTPRRFILFIVTALVFSCIFALLIGQLVGGGTSEVQAALDAICGEGLVKVENLHYSADPYPQWNAPYAYCGRWGELSCSCSVPVDAIQTALDEACGVGVVSVYSGTYSTPPDNDYRPHWHSSDATCTWDYPSNTFICQCNPLVF